MTLDVSKITKQVQLERTFPDDLETHFVSHFVVQQTEDHFVLTFFEVWPPVIVGTPQEKERVLDQIKSVQAKCVSRIVMTPERMHQFASIITENLKKSSELKGEK